MSKTTGMVGHCHGTGTMFLSTGTDHLRCGRVEYLLWSQQRYVTNYQNFKLKYLNEKVVLLTKIYGKASAFSWAELESWDKL